MNTFKIEIIISDSDEEYTLAEIERDLKNCIENEMYLTLNNISVRTHQI